MKAREETQQPLPVRILCLSQVWPHRRAPFEAANVIAFEIAQHLAADPHFEVTFARVGVEPATWPDNAIPDRETLDALGVRFLEVDVEPSAARGRLARALDVAFRRSAMVPGAGQSQILAPVVEQTQPQLILTIWSEFATALAADIPLPKFAYYGNVAHRLAEAGYAISDLLPGRSQTWLAPVRRRWQRQVVAAIKHAHLAVMRSYDRVADVANNDAEFYRAHDVKGAFYLRNMWPDEVGSNWRSARDECEQTQPLRIAGNVGNLSATGNTFGLHLIATEIVPALVERLGTGNFEIHLYGGRSPHPAVAPLLSDPHIKVRGFVEDLDREILEAPVFLVANNHDLFRVGHTRFLHAWSLGSCVVAFKGSQEAMPEIEHDVNALLGATPAEVADLIVAAGRDRELRRRIGASGVETLLREFQPTMVCKEIGRQLLEMVRPSPAARDGKG